MLHERYSSVYLEIRGVLDEYHLRFEIILIDTHAALDTQGMRFTQHSGIFSTASVGTTGIGRTKAAPRLTDNGALVQVFRVGDWMTLAGGVG
jgi:hypothetical protein